MDDVIRFVFAEQEGPATCRAIRVPALPEGADQQVWAFDDSKALDLLDMRLQYRSIGVTEEVNVMAEPRQFAAPWKAPEINLEAPVI